MRNIRLRLQYEGTRYQGWQKQTSTDNTIQGKMETLLTKMCGEPIEISASGRTDAGGDGRKYGYYSINPAFMRVTSFILP